MSSELLGAIVSMLLLEFVGETWLGDTKFVLFPVKFSEILRTELGLSEFDLFLDFSTEPLCSPCRLLESVESESDEDDESSSELVEESKQVSQISWSLEVISSSGCVEERSGS